MGKEGMAWEGQVDVDCLASSTEIVLVGMAIH